LFQQCKQSRRNRVIALSTLSTLSVSIEHISFSYPQLIAVHSGLHKLSFYGDFIFDAASGWSYFQKCFSQRNEKQKLLSENLL